MNASSGMTLAKQPVTNATSERRAERAACFHCGLPCNDRSFTSDEKTFCCNGCLTVHDILSANGLGLFYELSAAPGTKIQRETKRDQWAFLSDPQIALRLLDFTDGHQSRVTLQIPAIHCIACVWLLENLYRIHPGISRSSVDFQKREVGIQFQSEKIKLGELVALLASIGYEPTLTLGQLDKPVTNTLRRRQWLQIGIAGFAFGNIMLFSLPTYFGMDSFSGPAFKSIFGWLSLALALPVLVFSAAEYWKSAILAVRQRMLTLDIPIALGLAALYAQSAFAVIAHHGEHYLDSMVGLIFLLLCGRMFQQRTHDRLAFERDYKSFFPLSIRRQNDDSEEQISLSQLAVGDRILVRNSELVPADSTLASPNALIDYSFVTGESEPVPKVLGDYLYAGGKQIGATIEVCTVKPVSQSYLTSLWNHEAFTKVRGNSLDTLTNRYSRRFTFIVIAVAIGAGMFWSITGDWPRGLKAFTSVLIVACPCALALAAPFTLGTAQRLLGSMNVFLKNVLVIERMAQVDTIVFDKTGTLTSTTSDGVQFDGSLNDAELALVYSLARHSTHPNSVRVSDWLTHRVSPRPIHTFHELPGRGIQGIVDGHELLLGSARWLDDLHIKPTCEGNIHVSIDGKYRGVFLLPADIRPQTANLLRELADQYQIALLSGDNDRERDRFQALFGTNANLNFNQSPLDKLGFIKNLQLSGRKVMMVGDGLNDAGALKQSDVGVAVVEKVGTFSPASDAILEASNVPRLYEILTMARRSARIVRAGFIVSGAYNLIGISIAAAGWLSPLVCAVLMPISSISVVAFACGMTVWTARKIGITSQNSKLTEVS